MVADHPWLQQMRERELAQFPVGAEVVVRLNGECPRGLWHGDQEEGMRGIVVGTDATHGGPGHVLAVCYRQPLPVRGQVGYYTPGELRPFDIADEIARALGGSGEG